jgi:hypothetical protein
MSVPGRSPTALLVCASQTAGSIAGAEGTSALSSRVEFHVSFSEKIDV